MLNRRILRVKAMQALYSFFTTQESLKDVVREKLESQFYPDPAKDDFAESDKFTARRKTASRLFTENLESRSVDAPDVDDRDLIAAVQTAIDDYFGDLNRENRGIRNSMLGDIDDINKLYLKLLALPIEFAHIERQEKEKREKAYIYKESTWRWNLIRNPLIDDLTKFEPFTKAVVDLKISWEEHYEQLRTWYKDVMHKDEVLMAYEDLSDPTVDDHKEAILHFYKKILFKNESINEFLSEEDIHWIENKPILRSLIAKTFQDYEQDLDPCYELRKVSNNEEEDMDFFKMLYKDTLKKNAELDDLIEKKIKNWDISRVALTDRIILKMALTEMMLFPSIPVKVTINEFIEISKIYSTPKSKQFINGILDVLANELTSEGVIRKSGRGLIDNK